MGFDPTAPSLHMGNLVQLVTARRLQDAGHTPYILVGGATGMIGDPRDSGERTLNSLDTVKEWTERVRQQVSRFVTFEGSNAATTVNNYDWTASLSTIDFLRDIGKHFPVNRMLARDTVKRRLESGISYTEFSYVLLQSMDFLNLFREHGVVLQFGGSDQWGNITGGAELIRRVTGENAYALRHAARSPRPTAPSTARPRAAPCGSTPRCCRPTPSTSSGSTSRTRRSASCCASSPSSRARRSRTSSSRRPTSRSCGPARSGLADEVTALVHGAEEVEQPRPRPPRCSAGATWTASSPTPSPPRCARPAVRRFAAGELPGILDLFVAAGLAKSKGEARRTVAEGGAYLNNVRVEDPELQPSAADLVAGSWLVLRRGKKKFAGVEVS